METDCEACGGQCFADCDEMRSPPATGIAGKISLERAEFESWALDNGFHLSQGIHRDYENSKLNWMWKAWLRAKGI